MGKKETWQFEFEKDGREDDGDDDILYNEAKLDIQWSSFLKIFLVI
jgi:hypothetical protein